MTLLGVPRMKQIMSVPQKGFFSLILKVKYSGPKLTIQFAEPTDLVWNDVGSGADEDGSFWTVNDPNDGFSLLSDVACGQPNEYKHPCDQIVLVKAEDDQNSILQKPLSVTQIWNDKGSGADSDVAIYRLNPANGYYCLGMVAVNSYDILPDLDRYRCVRNDYVDEVKLQGLIWSDKGSGADKDFSAYDYQHQIGMITTGLFYGADSYDNDYNLKAFVMGLIESKTEEQYYGKR